MKTLKIAMILGAVFLGYSAFASDPVISDVTVRQRWPWSKLVDIDYVLTCDDTKPVDIKVSGSNDVTELVLPMSSLSGDLYGVASGARRIVWDPTVTAYTNSGVIGKFRAVLVPAPAPLYMIVDLTKTPGASGQVEYVYEADLRAGTWGSWVENPVTNNGTAIQSVVWTGVTNDAIYATDKLVLRRVPAGSFAMGKTAIPTTLTKACYAGVFQVTESQWARVIGSYTPSTKPRTVVSYHDLRGAPTDVPSVNWPVTDRSVVTSGSFLEKLRTKTGIADFDLPTEAQGEYLCRAGTTTAFNDGNAAAQFTGTVENNNGNTNSYLSALGWYKYNCTGAKPVGQKVANAWGLYDMHGNVFEWCLDWWNGLTLGVGGVDPKGPTTGTSRIFRGGGYNNLAFDCRSEARNFAVPTPAYSSYGFRLVRTLP